MFCDLAANLIALAKGSKEELQMIDA